MKKTLNIAFIAIITLVAAYFGREVAGALFSTTPDGAEILQVAVESLNKQTPMMVDNDTRLDSAHSGPGMRFTYNYTLVNYSIAEIDGEEFHHNLAPNIRKAVCEKPEMAVFFRNGITVVYAYRDKNGADITEIVVPPSDCDEAPPNQ